MKKHVRRNVLVLCFTLAYAACGIAQELFVNHKPIDFTPPQKVVPAQTLGGYPVLTLGGDNLFIVNLKATSAGGGTTPLPMGRGFFIDARDNMFFASIFMDANLAQSAQAIDWTDEPCKASDVLWKRSTGGNFSNVNCVVISHVTKYAPEVPTVVSIIFTRYASSARRLSYFVNVNPERFGFERDNEPEWAASGWHKSHIQSDPKKVEFLSHLQKWAEDVQDKMNDAFDKKADAFSGIAPLASYF